MIRNNPQLWRIAEYLDNVFSSLYLEDFIAEYGALTTWEDTCQDHKDKMYDKALDLYRKIQNNTFTGEDSHDS